VTRAPRKSLRSRSAPGRKPTVAGPADLWLA
jgi:hypothetical protein